MSAGIVKLGDLINSVTRKPNVSEFETFLHNLFCYGTPKDSLLEIVSKSNLDRKKHTIENIEIINGSLSKLKILL